MNGSELSFKYYESFGLPEFSSKFPELFPLLCFGLAGAGSECYGFDDELSQDHDFEPGFCVFYPEDKLDSRQVFALERAYAKLPKDFMGFSRSMIAPYGGERRRGVIGVNEFFSRYVPGGTVPSDPAGWAALRDELLCEALNGVVFSDNYGLFSEIRSGLRNVPDDIRKKRLSGLFFSLSQSGWYNVPRMLKRGDFGAVRLFLTDFVIDAAKCLYVLNDQFCPYKKWLLRGLKSLPVCGISDELEALLNVDVYRHGRAMSELICSVTERLLEMCSIKYGTVNTDGFLEAERAEPDGLRALQGAAFSLNGMISDNNLRNSDIMLLV